MAKKKVDEPFVQMFELKGLKANEALMVCKVWSFQSNGLECFLSNKTWANFLGCSPSTVTRIKKDLVKKGVIERDQEYLRLMYDMPTLINRLNHQYIPKYKKSEQKLPYWLTMNGNQNDTTQSQNEHTPSQVKDGTTQDDSKVVQYDNLLYNRENNKVENIENTLLAETWSLSNFIHREVTSINQIDFDITDKVELRNLVLSYWYNCFSTIELVEPINLFLDENFFNIFTRIIRETSTGRLNPNYLHGVNINYFLLFIKVHYESEQDEVVKGSTVPIRQFVNFVIGIINDFNLRFPVFLLTGEE